jgi:hypothetical protein
MFDSDGTPFPENEYLSLADEPSPDPDEIKEMIAVGYQVLVGGILWIARNSAPDLSFAVSMLHSRTGRQCNFGRGKIGFHVHWLAWLSVHWPIAHQQIIGVEACGRACGRGCAAQRQNYGGDGAQHEIRAGGGAAATQAAAEASACTTASIIHDMTEAEAIRSQGQIRLSRFKTSGSDRAVVLARVDSCS